jgi:membrane protein
VAESRKWALKKFGEIGGLIKDAGVKFFKDGGPKLSASMAFYLILSLYPLTLWVITIAGFFFGERAARGELVTKIRGTVGPEGAVVIEQLVAQAGMSQHGILSGLLAMAMLLIGASGLFSSIQSALNTIWQVPDRKRTSGILAIVREQFLAFILVLGASLLLLTSLILTAILTSINDQVANWLPYPSWLAESLNIIVSFALTTTLFAMIFKWLPETDLAWSNIWLGAALTSAMIAAGRYPIGLYLSRMSYLSAFGAAEALVIFLIWIYYSSWLFLFGAEFTFVYATRGHQPVGNARKN